MEKTDNRVPTLARGGYLARNRSIRVTARSKQTNARGRDVRCWADALIQSPFYVEKFASHRARDLKGVN